MSEKTVELPQGTVAYRDEGEGPAVVFSHGLFVDSGIWDGVAVHLVAAGFRCVRPESPMGSHRIPLDPEADLSPPGVAELLADFLEALDLDKVTVVGNDSGGAVAQMLAAKHSERIASLVLTNCDALEVYPPVPFNLLPMVARIPGGTTSLGALMRLRLVRAATYRLLTADPIPDAQLKAWLRPARDNPGIRRDVTKLLTGVHGSQTIEAAETLRKFDKPVLMPWGAADRFFKLDLAHRLAAMIPNAKVEPIEGGKTFVMLDRPDELSRLIVDFRS